MTEERLNQLVGMVEEATTDGDLSGWTGDDIGDIYSALFAEQTLIQKLRDMRRIYGEQKDDPELVEIFQSLLTVIIS